MRNLRPHGGDNKLVIAFDIGTTFSGVSYCILERGQVPEVLGVTRWPGQDKVIGDAKVPSILYYDKGGNVRSAGAEALAESVIESALTEGWTMAQRWKPRLLPKHLSSSMIDDDLPPLPPGKSTVHILTDFILYLFKCTKTYIKDCHPAFPWSSVEHSIQFIFTHPNDCLDKEWAYRLAIESAGLIPNTSEGRSRLRMLSEGEASIHFCIANILVHESNLASPQGVVLINAGDQTIDISMFSMKWNPISCEEIAPPECLLQGSVFVTRRAKVLLESWDHSSPDEIAEYTREFTQTTQLGIKNDQETAHVRVAGRRYNNPKYNISFGKLELTGEEATGLFNESIDAIIGAFERQQKYATMPITLAFLVGGLSTNDWLWYRILSYFKDRNINIHRPDNHINKAVANGAVLSCLGCDNHLVSLRVARATYGILCAVPVDMNEEEHIRRKDQWEIDLTGDCYVPGHFEAKVFKGNKVCEEWDLRESFSLTEAHPADFGMQVVRLVRYRGKLSKPEWVVQDPEGFTTLCHVHVNLSEAAKDLDPMRMSTGQIFYQLDYDVIVFFGFTELKAQLSWNTKDGGHRIPAAISFDDSPDQETSSVLWNSSHSQPEETPLRSARKRTMVSPRAEDAKKISTLLEDIKKLQLDLTAASSRVQELEQLHATQCEELETKAAAIGEKNGTISALTAEIVQLKQLNAEKTRPIDAAPQDLQPCVQYGVVCSLPVDANDEEHICRQHLWEIDPTGDHYVPGYFESKLRVGPDTREEREFREPFSLIKDDPVDFGVQTVRILCYQGDLSDPKWVDEDESSFSIFCTIYIDLDEAVRDLVMKKDESGKVYYQLDYDVVVSFGRAAVHAELCWATRDGERRFPATVSYEDED